MDNISYFGQNAGFGVDFGIAYKLNDKFSFDFSVNDLGSINWTDNVTNYNLQDVTDAVYNGFDFENSVNIQDDIEDALNNIIGTNESNNSFKSKIGSKILFSSKYFVKSVRSTPQSALSVIGNPNQDGSEFSVATVNSM